MHYCFFAHTDCAECTVEVWRILSSTLWKQKCRWKEQLFIFPSRPAVPWDVPPSHSHGVMAVAVLVPLVPPVTGTLTMQLCELEMPDPFRPKEMIKINAPIPKDGCSCTWLHMLVGCHHDNAVTFDDTDYARNGWPFIPCQSMMAGLKMLKHFFS